MALEYKRQKTQEVAGGGDVNEGDMKMAGYIGAGTALGGKFVRGLNILENTGLDKTISRASTGDATALAELGEAYARDPEAVDIALDVVNFKPYKEGQKLQRVDAADLDPES